MVLLLAGHIGPAGLLGAGVEPLDLVGRLTNSAPERPW